MIAGTHTSKTAIGRKRITPGQNAVHTAGTQSGGTRVEHHAVGASVKLQPDVREKYSISRNGDFSQEKKVSSANKLHATEAGAQRQTAYVDRCSDIVLVTLDAVCPAARANTPLKNGPSASYASEGKPRNNRFLARSLTTSDMSMEIENLRDTARDKQSETGDSPSSHLTSSGVLFMPLCSHGPRRRRVDCDPGFAQARLCKRYGERRNALADPWSMTMPQDTRERIQEEVALRKKSFTRKVSQCLLGIFTDNYEVDLV